MSNYQVKIPSVKESMGAPVAPPIINNSMLPSAKPVQTPPVIEPPKMTNKIYKPYQYTPKTDPNFSDYNDPYQINSIADIVLTTFNKDMKRGDWGGLEDVPILNILTSTVDFVKDYTVKPIVNGDFGALALNTFQSFAETADIIANPVKAVLQGYGLEGAVDALGWGDNGRKNFDYDTGNVLADIGLEVVSDPLNWLTLFAKPLVTKGLKAGLTSTLQKSGMTAGDDLSNTVATAVKSYMKGSYKDLDTALEKTATILGTKYSPEFNDSFKSAMEILKQGATDMTNINILKGTSQMIKYADNVDDTIFKTALKTQPAIGAMWLSYKGYSEINKYVYEEALKVAKQFYDPNTGRLDLMQLEDFEKAISQREKTLNPILKAVGGWDGIDDKLKQYMVKGAAIDEISTIVDYVKQLDAKGQERMLPQEKVDQVRAYLDEMFGGDYSYVVQTLDELVDKQDSLRWFVDLLKENTTYSLQIKKYNQDMLDLEEFLRTKDYSRMGDMYAALSSQNYLNEQKLKEIDDLLTKGEHTRQYVGDTPLYEFADSDEIVEGATNTYHVKFKELDDIAMEKYAKFKISEAKEIIQQEKALEDTMDEFTRNQLNDIKKYFDSLDIELTHRQKLYRLNKFCKTNYNKYYSELMKDIISRPDTYVHITRDYSWLADYINKSIEYPRVYSKLGVQEMWNYIRLNIFDGDLMDAIAKYKGLEDYCQIAHKCDIEKYIAKLIKNQEEYGYDFTSLVDTLRQLKNQGETAIQVSEELATIKKSMQFAEVDAVQLGMAIDNMKLLSANVTKVIKDLLYKATGMTKRGPKDPVGEVTSIIEYADTLVNALKDIPFLDDEKFLSKLSKRIKAMSTAADATPKSKAAHYRAINKLIDDELKELEAILKDYKAKTADDFTTTIDKELKQNMEKFTKNYDRFVDEARHWMTLATREIDLSDGKHFSFEDAFEILADERLHDALVEMDDLTGQGYLDELINNIYDLNKHYNETEEANVQAMVQAKIDGLNPYDVEPVEIVKDYDALDDLRDYLETMYNRALGMSKVYQTAFEKSKTLDDKLDMEKMRYVVDQLAGLGIGTRDAKARYLYLNYGVKWYKMQQEKMFVTEQTLSNESIISIVNAATDTKHPTHNILHNLAEEGSYEAARILQVCQSFNNYKNFRTMLAKVSMPDDVRTAVLSTIHNKSKMIVSDLVEMSIDPITKEEVPVFTSTFKGMMYDIFEKTEIHYNSIVAKERINMKVLIEEYITKDEEISKEFEALVKDLGLTNQHTALYDSVALGFIANKAFPHKFTDVPGLINVTMDIETTGSNKYIDDILQIGMHSNAGHYSANVMSDLDPTNSLKATLVGSNERPALRTLYQMIFKKNALPSMEAMLGAIDHLEGIIGEGNKINLILHNGKKFDIPFIKEQLVRLVDEAVGPELDMAKDIYVRAQAVLKYCTVHDTLPMFAELKGYMKVTDKAKEQVTQLMKELAVAQNRPAVKKVFEPYLIQPFNSVVAGDLLLIAREMEADLKLKDKAFVDKIGNMMAKADGNREYGSKGFNAKTVADEMDYETLTFINDVYRMSGEVFDFYNKIKTDNRTLGLDIFSVDTDAGFNETSRLLYSDDGQFISGIRPIGYKTIGDVNKITDYFKFKAGDGMDTKELERYNRYANYIEQYMNRIKGGTALKEYAGEINKYAKEVWNDLTRQTECPKYIQNLRLSNTDYKYNYALLMFMSRRPEGFMQKYWSQRIPKELGLPELDYMDELEGLFDDYVPAGPVKAGAVTKQLQYEEFPEWLSNMLVDPKRYVRQTQYKESTLAFLDEADSMINTQRLSLWDTYRSKHVSEFDMEQAQRNRAWGVGTDAYDEYLVQRKLKKMEDRDARQIIGNEVAQSASKVRHEMNVAVDNWLTKGSDYNRQQLLAQREELRAAISEFRQGCDYHLKGENFADYTSYKEAKDAYEQMYTDLLMEQDAVLENRYSWQERIRANEKLRTKLEAFNKKINKLEKDMRVYALDSSVESATKAYEQGANYFTALGQSLDDNHAYRAWTQRKIALFKSTHTTLKKFEELIKRFDDIEAKETYLKHANEVTNRRAVSELYQVLKLSNEDLFTHLATSARRLITFRASSYHRYQEITEAIGELMARKGELKKLGINVFSIEESPHIYGPLLEKPRNTLAVYITLDKEVDIELLDGVYYYNGRALDPVRFKEVPMEDLIKDMDLDEYEIEYYTKYLTESRNSMINVSENAVTNALGDLATKDFYYKLYEQLPDKVKKTLPPADVMYKEERLQGLNYNHSAIGTIFDKRQIASMLPSDELSIQANTMQYISRLDSTKVEYINLYYDKSFSINNGVLKDMSDVELFNALKKSREFTLTYLQDIDGKPMAQKIKLTSPAVIQEARRLNAVIVPTQTYNKIYPTLLSWNWSSSKFNFWHRIIYMYKSGYLASVGVIFRNIIDSSLKNFISTGDPLGMIQSYWEGMTTYYEYRRAWDDILRMSKHNNKKVKESIDFYFANMNPKIDRDTFNLVYDYMEDGASAGMIKELEEYYTKNKEQGLWDMYVHMTSKLMSVNNEVEQIARLSEYLWAIRHAGYSNTKAYHLVSKTHFDYGLKTPSDLMAELVFPFYTFKMRNLEYWMEAIEMNPALLSLFRDVMTPIWNFDDYNQSEYSRNKSLQYQILSGNLQLDDTGLNLKLSPSFMDAYKMIVDPLGSASDSLAAPIKAMMDMTLSGTDNSGWFKKTLGTSTSGSFFGTETSGINTAIIPFVGSIAQRMLESGPKYYGRTGNALNLALPSVFGATQRWDNNTSFRPYRSNSYTRKPKYKKQRQSYYRNYTRKVYTKKAYTKNYYSKRPRASDVNIYEKNYTKTGKSKMWMRTTPMTPQVLKYKIITMHRFN